MAPVECDTHQRSATYRFAWSRAEQSPRRADGAAGRSSLCALFDAIAGALAVSILVGISTAMCACHTKFLWHIFDM